MIPTGYLIVAQNTADVDYISCARTLAKSIHYYHPGSQVCLLTDKTGWHDPAFDIIKPFPHGDFAKDSTWKLENDWQVYDASPFHETIKLEADMIVTADIQHWFNLFRHRDLVVSTGCCNWQNQTSRNRTYRKIFDNNQLPDCYNAITYWRQSRLAKTFFSTIKAIFANWDKVMNSIQGGQGQPKNTDLAYAIAVEYLGREHCILPDNIGPQIVHMKQHIAGIQTERWDHELVWEFDQGRVRINGYAQHQPLHYHVKTLAKEFEKFYEQPRST